MRAQIQVAAVVLATLYGCEAAPTTPAPESARSPAMSVVSGPPAQSGIVSRFTNADVGFVFSWSYDPTTQLLIHQSADNGLNGVADFGDFQECIAPTESASWAFQFVATPSGDVHDLDAITAAYTRVFDATGVPIDPVLGAPWPTCELMNSDRLVATGRSHVRWVDNDYFGIGGPGANSFGRIVNGQLESRSGQAIRLLETARWLIKDGEFQTLLDRISISPDPRE